MTRGRGKEKGREAERGCERDGDRNMSTLLHN